MLSISNTFLKLEINFPSAVLPAILANEFQLCCQIKVFNIEPCMIQDGRVLDSFSSKEKVASFPVMNSKLELFIFIILIENVDVSGEKNNRVGDMCTVSTAMHSCEKNYNFFRMLNASKSIGNHGSWSECHRKTVARDAN